ncbi:MAG: TonB-dependent receptor, partial [Thiobacillaceae bacterium]|nr:TonB-dependent receptor [Thiobacillaceae bacterium]
MKTRLTPIAALLALHAAPAMAMEIHTLDSIVVTATRPITDPAMLFRLDDEDIAGRRAATSDSASLLRDIPGVTLYGAG